MRLSETMISGLWLWSRGRGSLVQWRTDEALRRRGLLAKGTFGCYVTEAGMRFLDGYRHGHAEGKAVERRAAHDRYVAELRERAAARKAARR